MARIGAFDVATYSACLFDITCDPSGWLDRDFIFQPTPTPPTPPTPSVITGLPPKYGGGARWWPENWEVKLPPLETVFPVPAAPPAPITPPPSEALAVPEPEADYAAFAVGDEALIRAFEAGELEFKASKTGELVILLRADSGKVYLFANVGRYVGAPRHVKPGDIIGVTLPQEETSSKPWTQTDVRSVLGAGASIPVIVSEAAPEALPAPAPARTVQRTPVDLSYLLEELPAPPKSNLMWWIAGGLVVLAVVVVIVRSSEKPKSRSRER
jgi:hypothetical protein